MQEQGASSSDPNATAIAAQVGSDGRQVGPASGAPSLAKCVGIAVLYLVALVFVLIVDGLFVRSAWWGVLAPGPPLVMSVGLRRRRQWRAYVVAILTTIAATALVSIKHALIQFVIFALLVVTGSSLPSG